MENLFLVRLFNYWQGQRDPTKVGEGQNVLIRHFYLLNYKIISIGLGELKLSDNSLYLQTLNIWYFLFRRVFIVCVLELLVALLFVGQILDDVDRSEQLLGVHVENFEEELVLDRHDHLDVVQRVQAQIVHEVRLQGELEMSGRKRAD